MRGAGTARALTRPAFLLCPPRHYAIRYEINPWMSVRRPASPGLARRQWETFRRLLVRRLRARVVLLPPASGLPDLTFTANAGLVHRRTLLLSRFRHAERVPESARVAAWFARRGYRVEAPPPGVRFEGEGDALRIGGAWLLGFRFRSQAPAHAWLSRRLGARVLPVELTDPRFYHLDTCFAPLDGRTALWYPRAFDRWARRVIESVVADPVAVTEGEALGFCCNAVAAGRRLVVHRGLPVRLRRALERRGFEAFGTDLSQFLKAGGAAKCLVLTLPA